MIETYKLLKDIYASSLSALITPMKGSTTRGHSLKLPKERVETTIKAHSFTHRIVNDCNRLPENMKSALSMNFSKNRLDVLWHYDDVIMGTIASQITSLTIVYSTFYSDADQRKHQSPASLAFVWGLHRDRWIPRTKGQLRGKYFHLMTSSWKDHPWLPDWEAVIGASNTLYTKALCESQKIWSQGTLGLRPESS